MISWFLELFEYDISFVLRIIVKSQDLANFMLEFSSPMEEEASHIWFLLVDGILNLKESDIGVLLKGYGDILMNNNYDFDSRLTSINQSKRH